MRMKRELAHGRHGIAVLLAAVLAALLAAAAPAPPAGRQPAPVFGHEHAQWLEREGRAEMEHPEVVIAAMNLHPGDVVAEIGCGTGFFSRRLAKAVGPTGKVYAEDIQPEMLDLLQQYAAKEGIANIVPVLGSATDPKLPPRTMDWILLVDVYHELQEPAPMLAKIRQALKPNGRVALVEYRAEDDSAKHIAPAHRMSVKQVLKEWNPAGFELIRTLETLPSQHLFLFTTRRGVRALP